jgi:hypothetical protein
MKIKTNPSTYLVIQELKQTEINKYNEYNEYKKIV